MIPALIILAFTALLGLVLWLADRRGSRAVQEEAPETPAPKPRQEAAAGEGEDTPCCGLHLTCEKDSLMAAPIGEKPEYFDDEELDAYAGRDPDEYTPGEVEQFRDVLLTLLPEDIAPWARSVQLRGIALPPEVRDELLLLVSEARQARAGGAG